MQPISLDLLHRTNVKHRDPPECRGSKPTLPSCPLLTFYLCVVHVYTYGGQRTLVELGLNSGLWVGQQAPLPAESHLTRPTLLSKTVHPRNPVSARLVDQEYPQITCACPTQSGVTGAHHLGFSVDVRDRNTVLTIMSYLSVWGYTYRC